MSTNEDLTAAYMVGVERGKDIGRAQAMKEMAAMEPVAWLYHDGPTREQIPQEFLGTRVVTWTRQQHYRNETPLIARPQPTAPEGGEKT